MLTASSDRAFGGSRVRSTLIMERRFRAHMLHRERLLFDSRFHPFTRRGADGATLYVVLAGWIQIEGSPEVGPIAYVLDECEFERVTPRSTTFRSWGAPSITLELRVATRDVCAPVGLAAGPVALGDRAWSRCRLFADACVSGDPIDDLLRQLLVELGDAGVIDPGVAASIPAAEPESMVRLWSALRPLYASHASAASLRQIKRATGLSLRQLGRDLRQLTRTFGLGGGYRDATRVLRLRAALVLLAAPTGTLTDIAMEVGYNSLDAMGRAFRDAKLPPPNVVQDAIRYRE